MTPKSKVEIDAEHVDITSAETTDKVALDKVTAAERAAAAVKAAADVAAQVKRTDAETAAEVRANEAATAKEVRATEAADAAAVKRLEWWKSVFVPVMIAAIAGIVTASPSIISSWSQARELREIKKTGKDNHTLLNSRTTGLLRGTAAALRAVARLTKNPDDEAAADLAEKQLIDQEVAQQDVDKGKRNP